MKKIWEAITTFCSIAYMLVGTLWILATDKEEARQYRYDIGFGEEDM